MRPTPSSAAPTQEEGAASPSIRRGRRSLLPLALGLTAALAASAGVAEAFVAPLPPTAGRPCHQQLQLQQQGSSSSRSRSAYGDPAATPASATRLWARRRKKGDDADFERFNLDELRDETRFAPVEEMDPEMFRPSKMEYYVPPPADEMELWDVTDTRCVWCGCRVCCGCVVCLLPTWALTPPPFP